MNTNEKVKLSWVENTGVQVEVIDGDIPHEFIIYKKDIGKKKDWWDAKKTCKDIFCQLPTLKQLSIIYDNKDEINALMEKHSGEPLKNDWYWSSSEYSSNTAWIQVLSDGGILNYSKYYSSYVRPVLALPLVLTI